MAQRFTRRFYRRDPVTLARALLGQVMVRVVKGKRLSGRIVEVEAYLGVPDLAAHTANGRRTARNATMWGEAGHAYVYFTYGMHHCVNIVADRPEVPTAVLIRALEPIEGIGQMRRHRAGRRRASQLDPADLCSGPAKLTQALGIGRELDGEDLTRSKRLFIERGRRVAENRIVTTARIGVAYARQWAHKPLRFYIADNLHVSVR